MAEIPRQPFPDSEEETPEDMEERINETTTGRKVELDYPERSDEDVEVVLDTEMVENRSGDELTDVHGDPEGHGASAADDDVVEVGTADEEIAEHDLEDEARVSTNRNDRISGDEGVMDDVDREFGGRTVEDLSTDVKNAAVPGWSETDEDEEPHEKTREEEAQERGEEGEQAIG